MVAKTLEPVGFAGLSTAAIIGAAAAAERGVRVVAFDDDIALTAALRRGDAPLDEPDLKPVIERTRERINYTATAADLGQCTIVYLFVDALANDKGNRDPAQVKTFLRDVAAASRPEAVLVIVGDVPPGYTRAHAPKGHLVFYQVQAPIHDSAAEAARPEWLIVGCVDPAEPLPSPLAAYLKTFECPVFPVRYESSELARVAIGLMCAASSAATTFLAELCEKAGADWGEIMPALKLDRRIVDIGCVPALSGPDDTVERDLTEILKLASVHKVDAAMIEAFLASRRRRQDWLLQRLEEHVLSKTPDARLAFIGFDEAASALLASLPKLKVWIYDPEGSFDASRHDAVATVGNMLEACAQADAVVLFAVAGEASVLDPAAIAETMRGATIVDPYGIMDPQAAERAGLSHHVLGRAS